MAWRSTRYSGRTCRKILVSTQVDAVQGIERVLVQILEVPLVLGVVRQDADARGVVDVERPAYVLEDDHGAGRVLNGPVEAADERREMGIVHDRDAPEERASGLFSCRSYFKIRRLAKLNVENN